MLTNQQIKILEKIVDSEYVTAKELADELNISNRTVRNRIQEINSLVSDKNIEIMSKARFGYYIMLDARDSVRKMLTDLSKEQNVPVTLEERIQFISIYLINRNDYIKMDDLADFLYVSRGTLSADLKQVEHIYNRFPLSIERRPNYGLRVIGEEFDMRRFLCEMLDAEGYIWKLGEGHVKEQLQAISEVVLRNMRKHDIHLSDLAYQDFVNYVYVALHRIRSGFLSTVQVNDADYLQKNDYYFVESLVGELEEIYHLSFPFLEKIAITIHLISRITRKENQAEANNFVIKSRIDKTVTEILDVVANELNVDLRGNLELRMSLDWHMVSMDIRLRYGLKIENPNLESIQQNYQFSYYVAQSAAWVLEEKYHVKISEEEIGFLAVIFELVISEEPRENRKYNILIVCTSGRGSAKLLEYKFSKKFAPYINRLIVKDAHYMEDFGNIDFVVTTVPLSMPVPVPILEINEFLKGTDITNIRGMLYKGEKGFMKRYFHEELFIPYIEGVSKEEILKELCEKAREVLGLPDEFSESVYERERLSTTDFGNLVAYPHPARMFTEETYVVAGILKEQVFWGRNQVQVVFLSLVGTKADPELKQFYETVVRFGSDLGLVEELIKNRTFTCLIDLMEK